MSLKQLAVNLFTDVVVAVMAADLLYLYYAGGWIEPIAWVRITELVLLWAFIPFGVWRIIVHIREAKSDLPGMDQR